MPVDLICLTPQERTIYQALVDAAENSLVCPNYLDLNELVGYESASASVGVVKRLEAKGLIWQRIVDWFLQPWRDDIAQSNGKG